MTEELKLILQMFQSVTDGALIGGLGYLIFKLIGTITPWACVTYLGSRLIDRLPGIRKKKQEVEV